MESTMLEYVLVQLWARKGHWTEVAEGSGVPLRTLEKIARKESPDPRVSSVQALYDWFRKQPVVPPPEPPRIPPAVETPRVSERDLTMKPAAQRNGDTDIAGKKNVRKEVLLTEQMAADLLAVATIKKMGESEYIRRCVEKELYGELELMRRSLRQAAD
jgi:hypothetical protein